jgi:Zn-dependent protease
MGHVASLRRHGISATAPMFIPGFGALVRLNERPATPEEDARIGLAGPWWGAAAAVAALGAWQFTDAEIWRAIAHTGAWINLFNLLPVWQLDGSRGAAPLNRLQRGLLAVLLAVLWVFTKEGLLVLLALAMAYRTFQRSEAARGHWRTFASFATLAVVLSVMTLVKVPVQ